MRSKRPVLTRELGAELRKLREGAGLTQGEVANRMGIRSRDGKSYVCSLEHGRIARPYLDTILYYLRACGVIPTTFFQLFNRIELLPVEWPENFTTKTNKDTKGPEAGEFTTKTPRFAPSPLPLSQWERGAGRGTLHQEEKRGDAAGSERVMEIVRVVPTEKDKAEVVQDTKDAMRRYQRKMAFPPKGAPIPPAKQKQASANLLRFRLLSAMIEKKVGRYMADTSEPFGMNYWYKLFSRHVLAVTRKQGLPENLDANVLAASFTVSELEKIQHFGLKEQIAGDVKALTIIIYAKLKPTMDS